MLQNWHGGGALLSEFRKYTNKNIKCHIYWLFAKFYSLINFIISLWLFFKLIYN